MNIQNFTAYPLNTYADDNHVGKVDEQWKQVPGTELQASSLGRIRYADGEFLAIRTAEDRNSYITTEINGQQKLLSVSVLVLSTFKGTPPGFRGSVAEFIKSTAGVTHEQAGKFAAH